MKVAPSILSVLDKNLNDIIKTLEEANVTYLHLDVMDGRFVKNSTFNYELVKTIKTSTKLIVDTHLMIEEPLDLIDEYIKTKSDILCFHLEATKNPSLVIDKIKASGLKAGLAIKPNTSLDDILPYLEKLDLVLVMSVEPGFGGQMFITNMLEKTKKLKELKEKFGYQYLIEMDGGINLSNAKLIKEVGCDIIVVGTFLFKSDNLLKTIEDLESI